MSDATWKRVKKRLAASGCELRWDPKTKTFSVVDPLWSMGRARESNSRRGRLAMLRAAAAALGTPYSDQLARQFERWDAELAAQTESASAPVLRPQPRSDGAFFGILRTVETALQQHRMIGFTYAPTAGGKPKERQIEPYALHDHLGRFYVWGRERVRQAPKFFALDRMQDVVLEDHFEPDAALSIDDALRHSFGVFVRPGAPVQRIVVEIDADRAAYVRARRWPAETAIADLADGRLRIEFSVTDPQEVVAWVLGFAGSARVVAPAAAADLARRAADEIASRHDWARRAHQGEGSIEFDWKKEP